MKNKLILTLALSVFAAGAFAEDGFDGTFVILGGSAGTFQQTSPGQFIAAAPDMAPFSDLTTEQVQSLLGGAR